MVKTHEFNVPALDLFVHIGYLYTLEDIYAKSSTAATLSLDSSSRIEGRSGLILAFS